MSANTVRKYVCELEEQRLISTESTTVTIKDGLTRNSNLLYTIRPIQLALDQFYEQQLAHSTGKSGSCINSYPLDGETPSTFATVAAFRNSGNSS